MVYDTSRSCFVLFGGYTDDSTTNGSGDTSELPSSPSQPRIVVHPATQTIRNGGIARFDVVADGNGPLTYQWFWADSVPFVDGAGTTDIARTVQGAATCTLELVGVRTLRPGDYFYGIRCRVTNPCASITTNDAELYEVPCGWPDFNNDGSVGNDADIEDFFACLAGNCCARCGNPDFNGDGAVATDADIEAFFRVLAGGPC
jgi:hypothetical protein